MSFKGKLFALKRIRSSEIQSPISRLPSFLRRANTRKDDIRFNLSQKRESSLFLQPAEELDKYDFSVPNEIDWDVEDVVDWIEDVVELPQYKEAFSINSIDGEKLVRLKPGDLPKMNITNFEHIKHILKCLKDLIFVREGQYHDSIAFPHEKVVRHRYLILTSKHYKKLNVLEYLMDENLVHECWSDNAEVKIYPLMKIGRINVPLHPLGCLNLNMDLIKQSEGLPFCL